MSDALLFVYGTLRRDMDHPLHGFLREHADFIGNGFYRGLLYRVSWYPGAVSSSNTDDRVIGEVYRLREEALVLSGLDIYEEVSEVPSAQDEYYRVEQEIELASGERCMAWVYRYQRSVAGLTRITSGDFVDEIKRGIARNG